jgi:hypothetical protein
MQTPFSNVISARAEELTSRPLQLRDANINLEVCS